MKLTTDFKTKSEEIITTSFEVKLKKTVATSFEVKPEKTVAAGFEAKSPETVTSGFEAKPPETVTTGSEAKPVKTVAAGSEAKPLETVATGFEAKPVKTVRAVLRPNHSQTVDLGLRLNQETRAPRLHVHGADRVSDMCDHPQSSASGLLLLPRSSSLHHMPHLPPAQHETSKHDSPNETKIKEKQNKPIPNLNSSLAKSMTHHIQTKELTTWFLNFPLDESIDNKSTKFEVQIQDPMKHS
jgi:hypothetical protein